MQAFVDTVFSNVDVAAFSGIRFICTSPVNPPKGFEAMWSVVGLETNIEDETGLSDDVLEKTSAIVAVSDVTSQDERAALTSFACWASTIPQDPLRIFLLPRMPASGVGAGQEAVASTRLMLESGCVDDVLWGAPMGFALALSVKAKLLSRDVELNEAKAEYDRRVMARATCDRILNTLDSTRWEYLRSRRLRFIPERQESEQLDEHGDRVAGLRVGKKVMSWLFGSVHLAVPQAALAEQVAADAAADGAQNDGEEAPVIQVAAGAANQAPVVAAAGNNVAQLLEGGEMTSLFIVRKRDIKSILGMRMINRYLQVMTGLRQFPHPNLPQLVQALQSPAWLYVQLQQRGTHSLFCALKRRDAPRRGVASEPIEATVIVDIVDHLAQALRHLHEVADLAHRDIKPEVIMLEDVTGPDGVKRVHTTLSGFELATGGRRVHTPCGTMPFAAPEIVGADSQGYDSMKADMWSLGITMLELMCGLRCVEVAVNAEDEMGAMSNSATDPSGELGPKALSPPSVMVADWIKQLFNRSGCIDTFLAKSLPEVAPLKNWVVPIFAGLLQVPPEQRFEASELVQALRFRQGEEPIVSC